MKLISGLEQLNIATAPCVATIGNFDGVHLGHQHVINTLIQRSEALSLPATVVTFEPLAKEFFAPDKAMRLTSLSEKLELLAELSVDQVLCINFDKEFSDYPATDFIDDVLVDGLGVKHLSVGDDFRFGNNREGDFNLLETWGAERGFDVVAHETYELGGERVSSGRLRQALSGGDLLLAKALLGRPYSIQGEVSYGQQLGRKLNYPTANIKLSGSPRAVSGVFSVTVRIKDELEILNGVANIGVRPTVDGTERRLEVHIFDFSRDIYGKEVEVTLLSKIRDEMKFDSLEQLTSQIQLDASKARELHAKK